MLKAIIIASALALSGAAFAQTQENQGENPTLPVPAARAAPGPAMQQKNTGMPNNNSTGHRNTKGAPKANTGTGGPGGTGNE